MCDLVLLCPPPESLPSKLFLPLFPDWASSPFKLRDDGVQQVSASQRRLSSAVQPRRDHESDGSGQSEVPGYHFVPPNDLVGPLPDRGIGDSPLAAASVGYDRRHRRDSPHDPVLSLDLHKARVHPARAHESEGQANQHDHRSPRRRQAHQAAGLGAVLFRAHLRDSER